MKKILRHCFHFTRWLFACTLIVVSLFLLAGRTFSLYVEDYASDIVAQLSSVLGVPVDVDNVSAHWRGLGAAVTMSGLRIGSGEEQSTIASLIVKPDVISSLTSWSVVWSRFEASGMQVELQELPSGRWAFSGIEMGGGGGGGAYLEKMILESNRVAVQDARIHIRSLLGHDIDINVHDMRLDYAFSFHRLTLQADLGNTENKLEFIAELTGSGSRLLDLDGLAYLKIDAQDVSDIYHAAQAELWPDKQLNMQQIPSAQVELWANFRAEKKIEWQGTATFDQIAAELLGFESGSFKVMTDLTGLYSSGLQLLDLQNTELELYADTIAMPDMQIKRVIDSSENVDYSLVLPTIQIEEVLGSLSRLPIYTESPLQQLNDTLNLSGAIGPMHFQAPNLDMSRWNLSGEVEAISVDSYQTAPAVKNLSGVFALDAKGGSIRVDAKNMALFFPKVYDNWQQHDLIQGVVSWRLGLANKELHVYSDAISVVGNEGRTKGAFRAEIPIFKGHPTGVDLTLLLGLQDSAVVHKDTLLPDSLPAPLTTWLNHSVLAGEVPSAGFIYRGSTKKGQSIHRTLQLRLEAQSGELNYLEYWPNLIDIHGQVWVSNGKIMAQVSSARLLDLDVLAAEIDIQPRADGVEFLILNAKTVGPSYSLLDLVRTTPLRDQVGDSMDSLDIQGQSESHITLSLPLKNSVQRADVDIDVSSQLTANQLRLVNEDLLLENLNGVVSYGTNGLSAEALKADIWQHPFDLRLAEDTENSLLKIALQGRFTAKDVANWLELDFLKRLSGEADIRGEIDIATGAGEKGKRGKADYYFYSDMRGITFEFPEPLAKSADQTTPLDIHVSADDLIVTTISLDLAGWDLLEGDKAAVDDQASELLFEISQHRKADNPVEADQQEINPQNKPKFHSARLAFLSALPEIQEGVFSAFISTPELDIDRAYGVYESEKSFFADESGSTRYGTLLGLTPDFTLETDRLVYKDKNLGASTIGLTGKAGEISDKPGAWQLSAETAFGSGSYEIFEAREGEEQHLPRVSIESIDINKVDQLLGFTEQDAEVSQGLEQVNEWDQQQDHLVDPRAFLLCKSALRK